MGLIELLSKEDLTKIDAYRKAYANAFSEASFLPAEDLLYIWEENKSVFLQKLFNNNLILEKEIYYALSDEEIRSNIVKALYANPEISNILTQIKISAAKAELGDSSSPCWFSQIYRAINEFSLATNHLNLQKTIKLKANNKEIFVSPGMKTMKLLRKLAKEFDIPGYEKLWKVQSMATNTKKIKGTLCLSIHPLDFMTMSDNDMNWTSCMSWKNDGCYRLGTVEMMNSSNVIIAYVKSEKDMSLVDQYTWNNKKWRSLFIVTPDMITNIKGYPYQSSALNEQVFSWLQELGMAQGINYTTEKTTDYNGRINCDKNNSYIYMTTNRMYNDYMIRKHTVYLTKNKKLKIGGNELNYSGVTQCMCCGSTNFEVPKYKNRDPQIAPNLCCPDCEGVFALCECCGRQIYEEGDTFNYHDMIYCSDCWFDHTVEEAHFTILIEEDTATPIEVYLEDRWLGQFWLGDEDVPEFAKKIGVDIQEISQISFSDLNESVWEEYHLDRYVFAPRSTRLSLRNS